MTVGLQGFEPDFSEVGLSVSQLGPLVTFFN